MRETRVVVVEAQGAAGRGRRPRGVGELDEARLGVDEAAVSAMRRPSDLPTAAYAWPSACRGTCKRPGEGCHAPPAPMARRARNAHPVLVAERRVRRAPARPQHPGSSQCGQLTAALRRCRATACGPRSLPALSGQRRVPAPPRATQRTRRCGQTVPAIQPAAPHLGSTVRARWLAHHASAPRSREDRTTWPGTRATRRPHLAKRHNRGSSAHARPEDEQRSGVSEE